MIKLCLITPIENLSLCNYGDMYFALTRQLSENKEYFDFFKSKKRLGFQVIVDNSVHEMQETDFEDHVKLAIDVGTIIIIPDVLRNKKKTLEYYHYFMDRWFPVLKQSGIKIMAVPQGETFEEIMECFEEFNNDKRVDFIGNSFDLIPFKLAEEKYENQSMNRLVIVSKWAEKCEKKIHLLGSNNLNELYILSKLKSVHSTDGKFFSRITLGGIKLNNENWKSILKPKDIKMDFDKEFNNYQKSLFKDNVLFFRECLNDRHL